MAEKAAAVYIPFGEWRPDVADLNTPWLETCLGVYATSSGYEPARGFTANGGGGAITGTALEGWAHGASTGIEIGVGTAAKLWTKMPGAVGWTDITRTVGGAYTATYWSAAVFGLLTVLANGVDVPQKYTTGQLTPASALGGSPPTFNYIATCGDFVFGLGTAAAPRTLRWSAINNAEGWTVGTGLCDEQEFPDGGEILGVWGDKEGFILQRDGVRRFRFIPGDVVNIFEFDKLPGIPGMINGAAWTVFNNTIYYVSHQGIVSLNAGGMQWIGKDRVDATALTLGVNSSRVTADVFAGRIIFPYSASSWIVYDVSRDKWTAGSSGSIACWLTRRGIGTGPQTYPLAVGTAGALWGLNLPNQNPQLITAARELIPARRAFVNGFRVNTDLSLVSPDYVPRVYTSEASQTTFTTNTLTGNGTLNEVQCLLSARLFKFEVIGISPNSYTYLNGFTIWPQPDGDA